jgi:hypothetical protein
VDLVTVEMSLRGVVGISIVFGVGVKISQAEQASRDVSADPRNIVTRRVQSRLPKHHFFPHLKPIESTAAKTVRTFVDLMKNSSNDERDVSDVE